MEDISFPLSEEKALKNNLCPICSNKYKKPIKLFILNVQKMDNEYYVFYMCPLCHIIRKYSILSEAEFNEYLHKAKSNQGNIDDRE